MKVERHCDEDCLHSKACEADYKERFEDARATEEETLALEAEEIE